jgi:hypothetical protein
MLCNMIICQHDNLSPHHAFFIYHISLACMLGQGTLFLHLFSKVLHRHYHVHVPDVCVLCPCITKNTYSIAYSHTGETSRMSCSRKRLQTAAEAGCCQGPVHCDQIDSRKWSDRDSSGAVFVRFHMLCNIIICRHIMHLQSHHVSLACMLG